MDQLHRIAERSLRANIVETPDGPALRSGGHQYSTLRTRDFCFAIPGLLLAQEHAVVRNHLRLLLQAVRPDGRVPRLLDEAPSLVRTLRWTVGRKILPRHRPAKIWKNRLKPEFVGEQGTAPLDVGILLYFAMIQAADNDSSDIALGDMELSVLKRIFRFYERITGNFQNLVLQPAYSDWQDSVRREGRVDYLNYLCLRLLKDAIVREWATAEQLAHFQKLFREEFQAGMLHPERSLHSVRKGERQISLETHLFRIQDLCAVKDIENARALWKALKDHPIFHRSSTAGVPVDPESPTADVSLLHKALGLRHYHDRVVWTWLIAETMKTAQMVGDELEARQILKKLEEICINEGEVPEVLDPQSFAAFENLMYEAERPFSWGAAKIIEAIAQLRR